MELNLFNECYTKENLAFNFGGFYHSIHDEVIDSLVDREADYREIEEWTQEYNDFYKTIDFNATCDNYVESMLEAIDKKLGCNLQECFIEIISPRYYNYTTDYILLDKTKANDKLMELFNQEQELKNYFDDIYNFIELEFELEFES